MTQLGQWLFEQQQKTMLAAIDRRLPRTGVIATATSAGVTVTDPLTGDTESEVLVPLGFRPPVGQRALILPLADGSRVVLPLGQTPDVTRRGALFMETDSADALRVRTAGGSSRFAVNTVNGEVQLWNAADLVLFSDAGVTEKGRIDGATGLITGAYLITQNQRGIVADLAYDGTPTTSTNASTTTYVEQGTSTLALPTGTYDVSVVGFLNFKNNTANMGARAAVSVNGTVGSGVGETMAVANTMVTLCPIRESTGLSGTITIASQYHAESGGTATARDATFLTICERTA